MVGEVLVRGWVGLPLRLPLLLLLLLESLGLLLLVGGHTHLTPPRSANQAAAVVAAVVVVVGGGVPLAPHARTPLQAPLLRTHPLPLPSPPVLRVCSP